jgi:D-glycero-beta-D-manno-heptose-7-phosphate kinase
MGRPCPVRSREDARTPVGKSPIPSRSFVERPGVFPALQARCVPHLRSSAILSGRRHGDQRLTAGLSALLDRMGEVRLLVLGDFLLDEFLFGEIARVSREAPVLILRYQETHVCPGGAANTVANAAALGAAVIPVGVVGDDPDGERLLELWPDGVERDHVIRLPGFRTTRKSRILAGSFHSFRQQVVRMDYEYPLRSEPALESRLLDRLESCLPTADAMIVSDYTLGNVTPGIREAVAAAARSRRLPLVVDSRDDPAGFPGATAVTPNIMELEAALGASAGHDPDEIARLGERARREWRVESLLVTRGKLGMILFTSQSNVHIPAYGSAEAVDVTGAGDTVAATYATALAAGASFEIAARLANLAGGLVVMKKGTATVSAEELRRAASDSL